MQERGLNLRHKKKYKLPSERKRKLKKKKTGLLPILGIHSKFDLRIMKEMKPPFDKKTQKKLKTRKH